MTKTAVGAAPDPDAFVYIARKFRSAGRSAAMFAASMENMIRALENARAAIAVIVEAYYFDREAQLRWEDEGGPCRD